MASLSDPDGNLEHEPSDITSSLITGEIRHATNDPTSSANPATSSPKPDDAAGYSDIAMLDVVTADAAPKHASEYQLDEDIASRSSESLVSVRGGDVLASDAREASYAISDEADEGEVSELCRVFASSREASLCFGDDADSSYTTTAVASPPRHISLTSCGRPSLLGTGSSRHEQAYPNDPDEHSVGSCELPWRTHADRNIEHSEDTAHGECGLAVSSGILPDTVSVGPSTYSRRGVESAPAFPPDFWRVDADDVKPPLGDVSAYQEETVMHNDLDTQPVKIEDTAETISCHQIDDGGNETDPQTHVKPEPSSGCRPLGAEVGPSAMGLNDEVVRSVRENKARRRIRTAARLAAAGTLQRASGGFGARGRARHPKSHVGAHDSRSKTKQSNRGGSRRSLQVPRPPALHTPSYHNALPVLIPKVFFPDRTEKRETGLTWAEQVPIKWVLNNTIWQGCDIRPIKRRVLRPWGVAERKFVKLHISIYLMHPELREALRMSCIDGTCWMPAIGPFVSCDTRRVLAVIANTVRRRTKAENYEVPLVITKLYEQRRGVIAAEVGHDLGTRVFGPTEEEERIVKPSASPLRHRHLIPQPTEDMEQACTT